MQHNAIHGADNKNFSKTLDTPAAILSPIGMHTYIDRTVQERIMQHNAQHGAVNKNFSKTLDTPVAILPSIGMTHSCRPAASANHVSFSDLADESSPANIIFDVTNDTIQEDHLLADDVLHKIVHSEFFEVPTIAQANMGHSSLPPSSHDTCALDDLLFDPHHYKAYSS